MLENILIIGSGTIGSALINLLAANYKGATIYVLSQTPKVFEFKNIISYQISYDDESSIENAISLSFKNKPFDLVIVATGILHDGKLMPEKSIKEVSYEKMMRLYKANTILPSIIAKHAIFKLNTKKPSIFATVSARIGSISDNRLGGWYAYRASKAALNMMIKTLSIEIKRHNENAIIVGLHPGTVDSPLSKPFQKHMDKNKLFSSEFAAQSLIDVMMDLKTTDTGKCFAWDKKEILP